MPADIVKRMLNLSEIHPEKSEQTDCANMPIENAAAVSARDHENSFEICLKKKPKLQRDPIRESITK